MASESDLAAIVARLGGELHRGGRAALVPGPGHSRNDRSLSLRLTETGRILWFSFAGDDPETVKAHLGLPGDSADRLTRVELERQRQEQQEADAAERQRILDFCRDIWSRTLPAQGSPVETYLRGRGITSPMPPALRYLPEAPLGYPWRGAKPSVWGAMVGIAAPSEGATATGLHLTALKRDGSGKAPIANPRRMFGQMTGASIRLSDGPSRDGVLAVAEGIETALAYQELTGTPTWAALSAVGLRRFTPPAGLKKLVVAADGDEAGYSAALALGERARRYVEEGVEVLPAPSGRDWNDVLTSRGRAYA